MFFYDLRMAYKLFSFFLVIVVFLAGLGLVGFFVSRSMADSMRVMYEHRMQPMHILDTCRAQNKENQVITQALLLTPLNKAEQNNLQAQANERFNAIDELLIKLEGLLTDEIEQQWLNQLWQEMTNYRLERQSAIDIALQGDHITAKQLYENKALLHLANMDALLQVMADRSSALAEEQNYAGLRLAAWAAPTIVTLSFVCVSIALVMGWLLNRLVTRPLKQMLTAVEEVAGGDYDGLTHYVPVNSRDEIGKLSQGFYKMSYALQNYLKELAEKNRQIFTFAYQDSLTGLPNRRQFMDRMGQLSQAGEAGFALLFIDLDSFKDINDTLGHNSGDELLAAMAERMVAALPEADTIARLGGDEFTVIYRHTGRDCVRQFAEKLLRILAEPVATAGTVFYVTVSAGISMFPCDGTNVNSLLRAADTAMYAAKRQGKNNYQFFTCDMHEAIVRRITLEKNLRAAVEREEFDIYFQPKVDTKYGSITGMEALLRWCSKDLGNLSPAEFIPVAEETGLIIPLGRWILRKVCLQNKAWQLAGLPALRVAVNLSPKQFRQQNFVEMVAEILAETQLAAEYLELEITEGTLIENFKETIDILRRLKELGVFISIDDFGTGYSSLEYLKRFPIDCLKIDKTFIDEIDGFSRHSSIAQAIILLGSSLNLKVVAEGVETEAQLAFLRSHNCDEVQGFYFYKPLQLAEFENILRTNAAGPRQIVTSKVM